MNPEVIKQLDHIIKINQRVVSSVGQQYITYLQNIFSDMITVYNIYSKCISDNINTNDSRIKPMKALRRDILKLIQTYIEQETDFTIFNQYFLPSLKQLMEDYVNSNPNSRDPETLSLFATIIKKDSSFFNTDSLKVVIDSLINSTLEMIKNDFTSFPEFREGFFRLVHNIITHCTNSFLSLDPATDF